MRHATSCLCLAFVFALAGAYSLAAYLVCAVPVILIILWLLGMVSGYTLGNFIYVLLVIAIVLFLVRLVSGRRV